jgi:hypothetical protein
MKPARCETDQGLNVRYVEIYADKEGISHFRDVEIELTVGDLAPPALPVELSLFRAATEVGFMSVPAAWVGGWHQPRLTTISSCSPGSLKSRSEMAR